jgi:toxin YoeB
LRNLSFTPPAFNEYNDWFENNPQVVQRIKILIREIDKDPFRGIGKPEPLRGNWSGYWSRRIDNEHRLVYKVTNEQILIAKCKGHY